jgi:hypothetical protein
MKDKPAPLTRAELETLRRLQEWLKQNPPVPAPTTPTPGEE